MGTENDRNKKMVRRSGRGGGLEIVVIIISLGFPQTVESFPLKFQVYQKRCSKGNVSDQHLRILDMGP